MNAELVFRTSPTNGPNFVPAIRLVKNILEAIQNYQPKDAGWSAAYYAALAVKASLRLGDTAEAEAILRRGLQMEPDSAELAYLSRVMTRER